MANSDIVTALKDKVIKEIANDEAFFYAIDPDTSKIENGGDLPGTHIFKYNKNPETITTTITFLTVMVDTFSRDRNKTFVTPTLTIWVYSHNDHMDIKNIKGIKDNRNDYISKLLDLKFNGTYEGIGTLRLVGNTEGTFNQKFLFRRLIFETIDLSDSVCESW